ncbi:MAG: hypothetical protein ACRCVJ_18635 [Clostridium sp.]|uniref:hypothetical protein n=1 Tax=Clostridium sp. TaxID=1506 RepID=UPI003F343584
MGKIKAIKCNDKLCFKCLQEKENINLYTLHERGYGSIYDGTSSKVQLCDECNNINLNEWFNEQPEYIKHCYEYKYENNIEELIKTLPIQGQEMFYNQCDNGMFSEDISSQDWIDIELNVAPDDVYKRNNMYSPSEINAYKKRFPTCKHVYLREYDDGSKSCRCTKSSAYGNSDGTCSLNISHECYYCKHYKVRKSGDKIKVKKEMLFNQEMEQRLDNALADIISENKKKNNRKVSLLTNLATSNTVTMGEKRNSILKASKILGMEYLKIEDIKIIYE